MGAELAGALRRLLDDPGADRRAGAGLRARRAGGCRAGGRRDSRTCTRAAFRDTLSAQPWFAAGSALARAWEWGGGGSGRGI